VITIKNGVWFLRFGWPGLVASLVGLFAAKFDVGPYFGTWIYILVVILLIQKRAKIFNIGLFFIVNAVLFGIAANQISSGILMSVVALAITAYGVIRLKRTSKGSHS
jgi:membrane-associated HD superfamily phosphohydrolase